MKLVLKENNQYILRIDRDEEFIESVKKFCKEERIDAGYFSVIGATEDAELAYYNRETREFSSKNFKESLEIVNVTGNIAVKDGEVIVHAHGVLSNKDMQTFGGHVNKLVISTIAEVILTKLEGEIRKAYSDEIGLNIME